MGEREGTNGHGEAPLAPEEKVREWLHHVLPLEPQAVHPVSGGPWPWVHGPLLPALLPAAGPRQGRGTPLASGSKGIADEPRFQVGCPCVESELRGQQKPASKRDGHPVTRGGERWVQTHEVVWQGKAGPLPLHAHCLFPRVGWVTPAFCPWGSQPPTPAGSWLAEEWRGGAHSARVVEPHGGQQAAGIGGTWGQRPVSAIPQCLPRPGVHRSYQGAGAAVACHEQAGAQAVLVSGARPGGCHTLVPRGETDAGALPGWACGQGRPWGPSGTWAEVRAGYTRAPLPGSAPAACEPGDSASSTTASCGPTPPGPRPRLRTRSPRSRCTCCWPRRPWGPGPPRPDAVAAPPSPPVPGPCGKDWGLNPDPIYSARLQPPLPATPLALVLPQLAGQQAWGA